MWAAQWSTLAFCFSAVACRLLPECSVQCYSENPAVQKFQEYLRIDTSQENNLHYAVEFWERQASELGLSFTIHRPAGKPICVLTWEGADPSLPSIMLNSHMDVVPVEEMAWTYHPFSAHLDENGDIFARGAQDDKDVSIQYIEAISRLKKDNVTLLRTLHVTLMPDEETGARSGMIPFRDTAEFKALNIGFVLDEGMASEDETLYVTYLDKRPWQIKFTVQAASGHGCSMPEDTASEKLQKLINVIDSYRKTQIMLKNSKDAIDFGAHTTVNVNIVNLGIANNVIPGMMTLVVDIRLSTSATVDEMQALVDSWAAETGNGTRVEFLRREDESAATRVDATNFYWTAMRDTLQAMGIKIIPIVCPASSDMLYLRSRGIPALGFAAKTNTVSRIHGANEYLNAEVLQKGIDIYVAILKKLGNVLPDE